MKPVQWVIIGLCLGILPGCAHSKHKNTHVAPPEEAALLDEEEYALGRQVAAALLTSFPPVESRFNGYATTLARYLATMTSRPTTFKGYRAVLIKSKEKAAFSTPGGFILVSEGLLASLQSEDELAGVLAHEVAHIVLRHGELAMDRSQVAAKNRERTSDALKAASGIFSFFSKLTGDERVEDASKISKGATEIYEGGAGEIHEKLIKSGYNQDQEYAADAVAMKILIYAGYQPSAFAAYLGRAFSSEKQSKEMSLGGFAAGTLFSTHPMDEKRIERITKMVSGWIPGPESQTRGQRFKSMQAGQ